MLRVVGLLRVRRVLCMCVELLLAKPAAAQHQLMLLLHDWYGTYQIDERDGGSTLGRRVSLRSFQLQRACPARSILAPLAGSQGPGPVLPSLLEPRGLGGFCDAPLDESFAGSWRHSTMERRWLARWIRSCKALRFSIVLQ
jgi:hypothetical protein